MNAFMTTQLQLQGINIAHAVAGQGEPVLMLHGWGAHSGLVWPLAERLAPLGYRVYAPDLPGFGASDPPPSVWSVHDYAALVIEYMDANEIEKMYLFGHSFGGRLSLILGAEHPQRIHKIVLADSAGVREQAPLPIRVRLATYKAVRDGLRSVGLSVLSDQVRGWYTDRYGSADYKSAGGVMRETFVKVVNEDLLPYAARIRVPTLLLWGENDEDTPVSQARLLEKTIPDAGLVVFPGAGHYSYLDKLPDTVRIIDHFFKQS